MKKILDNYLLSDNYTSSKFIKNKQEYMYTCLQEIIILFEKAKIKYFLLGGSLLGLQRDNKIIPYDNDIDIGIMLKDYNRAKSINNSLKERRGKHRGAGFQYKCVDIFSFVKIKNKFCFYYKGYRASFVHQFFNSDELFPLKRKKFGNLMVYIPNKPNNYLYRAFGSKCLLEKKVKYEKIHFDDKNLPLSKKEIKKLILHQNIRKATRFKNIIYYLKNYYLVKT